MAKKVKEQYREAVYTGPLGSMKLGEMTPEQLGQLSPGMKAKYLVETKGETKKATNPGDKA